MEFTDIEMPIVIRRKYNTNSNGFFTGLRNLTIESAPTIPNARAILSEIIFVIVKVITGNRINERV